MDAYEMEAWPPVWLPDEEAVKSSEVAPRAVNYFDPQLGQPFQLKTNGNSNALFQRIMQLEQRINRQFFVDVFLAVSQRYGGDKTAREVEEIAEEKLSSIGPMVSRLQSECFAPMIERVVDILMENGVIDPAPESIAGKGFRVVYTSRIDAKLSAIEVNDMLRAAQEIAGLLELGDKVPTVGDIMKLSESARDILRKRNISPDRIFTDRETKKRAEGRLEAQQEAEQRAAQQQAIKPIDPGKAPEEGSPLEQAASGMAGDGGIV